MSATRTAEGGRLPWVAAIGASVLFAVASVVDPRGDPSAQVLFQVAIVAFTVVGALLATRVRKNVVGWLLLVAGVILSVGSSAGVYASIAQPNGWPGAGLAALASETLFFYPIVIVLIAVPLVFPDGRLLSPRWRWMVALLIAAMTSLTLSTLFRPGTLGAAEVPNPLAVPALVPLLDVLSAFANWSAIVGFGGAAVSVVVRYRRAGTVERQQLKWLIAVASIGGVAFPVAILLPATLIADVLFYIGFLALIALPIGIGIAILRYRLYDIDRIISRTIGYGLVTGILAATFVVTIVGLEALLASFTQAETIAVAASTLIAFAGFQPLRRRVQAVVDGRFNRTRFDHETTATAFAERLREVVEIDAVALDLSRTIDQSVSPTAQALWLRGGAK